MSESPVFLQYLMHYATTGERIQRGNAKKQEKNRAEIYRDEFRRPAGMLQPTMGGNLLLDCPSVQCYNEMLNERSALLRTERSFYALHT